MEFGALGFKLNAESEPLLPLRQVSRAFQGEAHQMGSGCVARLASQNRPARCRAVQVFSLAQERGSVLDGLLGAHRSITRVRQ